MKNIGFPSAQLYAHNLAERGELTMAKILRGKSAAKAAKRSKTGRKTKRAASKTRRKTASPKQPKAPKQPQAVAPQAKPAAKESAAPHESLAHRIGGAFKAVVDTLADAERLHRQLDPDPSKDIAPE
jgi:hypothetical protein